MRTDPHLAARRPGAYSSVGPEALLRLGLDVHAPLPNLRPAFERLLPAALPYGYFGALQAAFAEGSVAPGDDEGQLHWLADHLHLLAPREDDLSQSWRRAWEAAAAELSEPAPSELNAQARRMLLDELLRRPRYHQRLADALVVAFRVQLSC